MKLSIDRTHDPNLRSWVESANQKNTDFPIQNLPFGAFARRGSEQIGVAIGDLILDLNSCARMNLLGELPDRVRQACLAPNLDRLMALGKEATSLLRTRTSDLLRADNREELPTSEILLRASDVELLLPARIGDYTDFYASVFHATNVGKLFRPDNPLLPNYKYVPIAYHGRASSIVASGTAIKRPKGQQKLPDWSAPQFAASRLLDYEVEVGFFIGIGNDLGESVSIDKAEEHIFGLCLVNDWSARDIQAWEYQPLGPFLAKNFATTISPWVVTLEALAPFRSPAFSRPQADPLPLPYLSSPINAESGGIDLTVEALILSPQMRQEGREPWRSSRASFAQMYWTIAQMLTHHASNGCNLCPGDLLASGTVSGIDKSSYGSLLELSQRGAEPVRLPTGETRTFLEDGDEIILRGYCQREGYVTIGLGECRGKILPASSS